MATQGAATGQLLVTADFHVWLQVYKLRRQSVAACKPFAEDRSSLYAFNRDLSALRLELDVSAGERPETH